MGGRRLDGRIAVVTGGGSGIGAATAHRLAADGAIVVLGDLDEAAAQAEARAIVAGGGAASASFVDLGQEDSIVAFYAQLREEHGRLDILHNNAADTRPTQLARDQAIATMEPEVWDQAFRVNTRGTMLMIKHGLPLMIAAGGGSIINTSSGVALAGDIWNSAYGASKAAIISLTRDVAAQCGRHRIRCNAVSPGLIITEGARRTLPPRIKQTIQRQQLIPGDGEPADLAAMVAFLASDDARFVTGQLLFVDGGLLSHLPQVADMSDLLTELSAGADKDGAAS